MLVKPALFPSAEAESAAVACASGRNSLRAQLSVGRWWKIPLACQRSMIAMIVAVPHAGCRQAALPGS
jgi:hypothetical protein